MLTEMQAGKEPIDQEKWDKKEKLKKKIRGENVRSVADPVGAVDLTLEQCNFILFNSHHSRWHNCTFFHCHFDRSIFSSAHFLGCYFQQCTFEACTFDGAVFDSSCRYKDCEIVGSDLGNVVMDISDPPEVRMEGTLVSSARITGHEFFLTFFPQYLCDRITGGKQATVYLGRDARDEQGVAIKVFDQAFAGATSSTRQKQRQSEVDIYRSIRSDFVPKYYSHNLDADPPYLMLERLPGEALSHWIAKGQRFDGWLRRDLFRQAFSGLHSLAEGQDSFILHRDIAPKNMIVDLWEGRLKWWFVDFGLSKRIDESGQQTFNPVGTPQTMAPEVLTDGDDSVRSEMFSLSATLAQAVTGRDPFGELMRNRTDAVDRIRSGPDLSGIEEPYLSILKKNLEFDPEKRYSRPKDVLHALSAFEN